MQKNTEATKDYQPDPRGELGADSLSRLGECIHTLTRLLLNAQVLPLPRPIAEAKWFQSTLPFDAPDFRKLGTHLQNLYSSLGGNSYHLTLSDGRLFWEALNIAVSVLKLDQVSSSSRKGRRPSEAKEPLVPAIRMSEIAQQIIHGAFSDDFSSPSMRIQQARVDFALALDEKCSDAYFILGMLKEQIGTYQLAEGAYETSAQIAALQFEGEEALLKRFMNNQEEPLWSVSEGKRYLRARAALAALLWKQREYKQAKELYQTLLKLDPLDHQNLRHNFVCLLVESRDHKALVSALKSSRRKTFPDGQSEESAETFWHYTNALYHYQMVRAATSEKLERVEQAATHTLQEAFGQNRYVPLLLLNPTGLPKIRELARYSPGDATEAARYINMGLQAWRSTPGALEWLEIRALEAHLLPIPGQEIPKISIIVLAPQRDDEEDKGSNSENTRKLHIKRVQRLGTVDATSEPLRISEEDAERTLDVFWKRLSFSMEGAADACWLWNGDSVAIFYHHTESWNAGRTSRIDPLHLAWVIGTGCTFSDEYSQLMPICQSLTCINPAHRKEVLPLEKIPSLLAEDNYLLGEDDRRELAWRFWREVEEERTPEGPKAIFGDGQWFVLRDDYERWRTTTGRSLEEAFAKKYISPRKYWRMVGGESTRKEQRQPHDTAEEWWLALGIAQKSIPQLVNRYQQILTELGGAVIDEQTARYHLDRLCTRILVQERCWYWDTAASNRFRLVKNGPIVEPRYLIWRLFTNMVVHPKDTFLASHDGDSACLCPAHSDILLDTSEAAFLLTFTFAQASGDLSLTQEQIDLVRSAIHLAVEKHELPYRINAQNGIDLWQSDVLSWAEAHQERIYALISEILTDASLQEISVDLMELEE